VFCVLCLSFTVEASIAISAEDCWSSVRAYTICASCLKSSVAQFVQIPGNLPLKLLLLQVIAVKIMQQFIFVRPLPNRI